jgi:hypothetical protein
MPASQLLAPRAQPKGETRDNVDRTQPIKEAA